MNDVKEYNKVTKIAQDYYNSEDADNFYGIVWGGEDIHIGLYGDDLNRDIAEASRKTVEHMSSFIHPKEGQVVLDIGAGYGGAVRYLVKNFPIQGIALNLSEKENERDRLLNQEAGLSDRIDVLDGSFEDIPLVENSVDIVWSQDAILHSGNKKKVLEEVARVLKPGGEFVFTDPMRADDTSPESLGPILKRIHLKDLGSPGFYKDNLKELGFFNIQFEERTNDLTSHYSRVLDETTVRYDQIKDRISEEYLTRMKEGLRHWVDGGKEGLLSWGIMYSVRS